MPPKLKELFEKDKHTLFNQYILVGEDFTKLEMFYERMEEPKNSSTPTEDKDIAVMTSPSSKSSGSGASTSGEAPVPGVLHEPMTADVAEAVSRDEEDSQMPEGDL